MRSPRQLIWMGPLIIGLLVAGWIWLPRAWPHLISFMKIEAPIPGALAPDFRLPPLDPSAASGRLSTYRPHVVLLTFWATWCAPCKRELPELQALAQRYRKEGLRVVAVSIDRDGAVATSPFAQILGLTFPILHDTDNTVARRYHVQAVPQSFLIDRDGRIRWRLAGPIDWTPDRHAELISLLEL